LVEIVAGWLDLLPINDEEVGRESVGLVFVEPALAEVARLDEEFSLDAVVLTIDRRLSVVVIVGVIAANLLHDVAGYITS